MLSRTKLLLLLMRTLLCEDQSALARFLLTPLADVKENLPLQGSFCVTNVLLYIGKLKTCLLNGFHAPTGISGKDL